VAEFSNSFDRSKNINFTDNVKFCPRIHRIIIHEQLTHSICNEHEQQTMIIHKQGYETIEGVIWGDGVGTREGMRMDVEERT